MNIEIKIGLSNIDWDDLFSLYATIGLVAGNGKKRNSNTIRKAFENSYKVVLALENNKIIGAGRMISDGLCYGMIFDVGILPEYQKKGIGKMIMNTLIKNEEKLCIHLTSTFGNEGFYRKNGFKKHKTAMAKYPNESEYLEKD